MVRVKALYFAAARELLGLREEKIDLGDAPTTATFRATLATKYPHAAEYIQDITLAVNLEYVLGDDVRRLHDDDEVALIPPISGG
ncbi:hypothetical protein SDRG_03214 [Saprolegnia diclina VS20]|uniref:Molybdopterin synthase sulfur carrier subunit n=1 Tax=Saprolegnia diclina (strain VS20) TaxID=1156394 RepID=T0QYM0_SAPDV|nr:hypothetical protein SDRG_03214 [Saprolegnia diclina VS20]EQC39791.1 hypothetical protein SDRG_03214 [Saprolegnia diclina VS20]|eukprot:XP_008607063.1 hypothetical protein SDRG_03214 [Saprolegnia diclina VS20]